MSTTAENSLQLDVPCAGCGYDLRGLTPTGKCPECGFDIDTSIRAARSLDGELPLPSRRWVRQMIEAVVIALLPFVISMVGNLFFGNPAGPPASLPYVLTATMLVWVLSSWSAWRLATLEPAERGVRGRRRIAVALRGAAVAFVTLGAVWVWLSGISLNTGLHLGVILFAATAAVTFYLRLRHVALRIGAPGLGGQALMIGLLALGITGTVRYVGSEGLFSTTPTTGWAGVVRYLIVNVRQWDDLDDVLQLVSWPILFTICQLAVLVQLLVALVRVRRRVRWRVRLEG